MLTWELRQDCGFVANMGYPERAYASPIKSNYIILIEIEKKTLKRESKYRVHKEYSL